MENKMTPIEALKHLQLLANVNDNYTGDDDCAEIIEQALTEHEKQAQILEVLKNKTVDINLLCFATSVEQYNHHELCKYYITKEEFDLLKGWLEK